MLKTIRKAFLVSVFILILSVLNFAGNERLFMPINSKDKVADDNVVLPPAWTFGVVYGAYTNQEQSEKLIEEIIKHDYPIDGFWIDSWIWDWKNQGKGPEKYMDFVADTQSYPDMKKMWTLMKKENIKAGMWVWDAIFEKGNEAAFNDFKSKGFFKNVYFRTDSWHNGSRTTIIGDNSQSVSGTTCGDIDFENPEAVKHFKQRMKHFFDDGLDFIKLDKTDAIPVCKAMFEMTQELGKETNGRGFILSHSGGVNSDEYKRYPGKWTDDTRSDWSAKTHKREFSPWLPRVGFKENIEMYLDTKKHFYKIPFLANDMGGFSVSTDKFVDEELYIRWLQFAMFAPLTTPFSQPENPTGNIAFKVSEKADKIFRDYAHLKMQLFPYIYTYAHLSRLEGVNTIRPFDGNPYQYLFGKEILVAPVYVQGATQTKVELPANSNWYDYWTGKIYTGGQTINSDASIEKIPLFIKQGAIIPKRKYARSIEKGTNDLLEIHVYAGANGDFELIEDDGKSNDYLQGIYAKTLISQKINALETEIEAKPTQGFYQNMSKSRRWQIIVHGLENAKTILLNGKKTAFRQNGSEIVIPIFQTQKSKGWKIRISQ